MITKGIIVSRPVESNKYSVRIPYFEEAGGSQFIAEATLSYNPGIVNSLNEGDVVFVAFEDHYKDKPTIVGKLFLTNDSSNEVGYANVQSLNVSDSATLPSNTKLGNVTAEQLSSLYMAVTSGGSVGPTPPTPAVSDLMLEITYSQLVTARNEGKLIPGMQYRITDYEFTTTTSNTSSANHSFDVIVVADDESTLNENARAIKHEGDTYFADSDLRSWRLEYCVDNDTSRFAWADTTNGKGVIYRMVDEFGNDCPYDFKNCLFTYSSHGYVNAYTFTYKNSGNNVDASLNKSAQGNVIECYRFNGGKLNLPFNVFYSTASFLDSNNNIFGKNCNHNTLSYSCSMNQFSFGCSYNRLAGNCELNRFDENAMGNVFGEHCGLNDFGYLFRYNNLGTYAYNNRFGDNCENIEFGDYTYSCVFGNKCSYVKFGDSSATINYVNNISIATGCSNLYIDTSDSVADDRHFLRDVIVYPGIAGTSSSNRKSVTITSRNGPTTTIYPIDSQFMQV